MNEESISLTLTTAFNTAWATHLSAYPVFVENGPVPDIDKLSTYVRVMFEWDKSKQANIAASPFHRYSGRMVIMLFGKEGTGTIPRKVLRDELTEVFKLKALGGVHTEVPTPGGSDGRSGWHSMTLLVPFFADSNT